MAPAGDDAVKVVVFEYRGRFAHFLRAEANANALSYPVPPRTVLLGIVGAVLGMAKDEPQAAIGNANLAVSGRVPRRFWHKANLRKALPTSLGYSVKRTEKGTSKDEKNTQIPQEWLWRPSFRVFASLPDTFHDDFAARIRDRQWHFCPSLGLSEMIADLNWIADHYATALPLDKHPVASVVPFNRCKIDTSAACEQGLAIQSLRMPRTVTNDRVFSHAAYRLERDGRPIPATTDAAWQIGDDVVMFL